MTGENRSGTAAPFAARQGVKERAKRAPRYAEDVFHAELLQIINYQIAQGHITLPCLRSYPQITWHVIASSPRKKRPRLCRGLLTFGFVVMLSSHLPPGAPWPPGQHRS